jgi:UDP-N-acetylmuramoyl-tripeptide--D-alanyl-D-alanine ligase
MNTIGFGYNICMSCGLITLLIVVSVVPILLFTLPILHMLHMFQQNSYNRKEHKQWRKRSSKWYFPTKKTGGIFRNAKKPLVMTSRAIRLLICQILLIIIFYSVIAIFVEIKTDFSSLTEPMNLRYWLFSNIAILYYVALYFFLPHLVMLANFVNRPIEKMIANYYIADTKKILKSHPNLIVIGITGSYGKTSTKNYLFQILSKQFNVLMTPESYNTPMGIALTVRKLLRPYHQILICEMGAKKPHEIAELCEIVQPKYGIVTSVGPAHLESFKKIEHIYSTKLELSVAVLKNGGSSFVHENVLEQAKKLNLQSGITGQNGKSPVSYGEKSNHVEIIQVDQNGTKFQIEDSEHEKQIFLSALVGSHNIDNILGCIVLARTLGMSSQTIASRVGLLKSAPHRLEIKSNSYNGRKVTILDDAYNANPAGTQAALDVLGMFQGKKVVITPGMVELGSEQVPANVQFGKQIAEVADLAILVGKKQTEPIAKGLKEAKFDWSKVYITENVSEGINYAYEQNGEVILLENDLPDNY